MQEPEDQGQLLQAAKEKMMGNNSQLRDEVRNNCQKDFMLMMIHRTIILYILTDLNFTFTFQF